MSAPNKLRCSYDVRSGKNSEGINRKILKKIIQRPIETALGTLVLDEVHHGRSLGLFLLFARLHPLQLLNACNHTRAVHILPGKELTLELIKDRILRIRRQRWTRRRPDDPRQLGTPSNKGITQIRHRRAGLQSRHVDNGIDAQSSSHFLVRAGKHTILLLPAFFEHRAQALTIHLFAGLPRDGTVETTQNFPRQRIFSLGRNIFNLLQPLDAIVAFVAHDAA